MVIVHFKDGTVGQCDHRISRGDTEIAVRHGNAVVVRRTDEIDRERMLVERATGPGEDPVLPSDPPPPPMEA